MLIVHRIKQLLRDHESIAFGVYVTPCAVLGVWLGYVARFGS